jgi:putative CocE/NonD family hydrolase
MLQAWKERSSVVKKGSKKLLLEASGSAATWVDSATPETDKSSFGSVFSKKEQLSSSSLGAKRPMRVPPRLDRRGTQLAGWKPDRPGGDRARGIIFDEDVAVPLPDGTILLADLFRPSGLSRAPVLVSWAAYIKDTERLGGGPFIDESGVCPYTIKSGYAVLRVQPRGTGRSGGVAPDEIFSPEEAMDCHHVIEWAAAQPWCDGAVGMTGMSYFAIAQLRVAATRPPSLKAIFPYKAMTDQYRHGFYKGGAPFTGIIELFAAFEKTVPPILPSWARHVLSYALNRPRFAMEMSDPGKTSRSVRKFLAKHEPPESAVRSYIARMFDRTFDDDGFWRRTAVSEQIDQIECPVCIATDFGAQDLHFFGAFELWHKLKSEKCLFIGPPEYVFPWSNYQEELVAWYDWRLRGVDNGYARLPPVRYWLRGADRWESASDWPVPEAKPLRLHLACATQDALKPQILQQEPAQTGSLSFLAIPSTSYYVAGVDALEAQVLRWQTAPYAAEAHVVGPVTLSLNLTASAIDTYIVARLSDIAPNGKRTKLSWGWLLASHRTIDEARSNPSEIVHDHSSKAARQLAPGEPARLVFSLNPIANLFRPGHRMELEIASRPELISTEAGEGFDMFHWDPVPYRSRNTVLVGGDGSWLDISVL